MKNFHCTRFNGALSLVASLAFGLPLAAQQVTFAPYIQLGDAATMDECDQMVVAWQTNETKPGNAYKVAFGVNASMLWESATPAGRVVDNYLSADTSLPAIPTAYGAHVNYVAVLKGLRFNTEYHYKVTGPGLPSGGFTASFKTRTKDSSFSFAVEGDEGYFPVVPNSSPLRLSNYEARMAHLIYNAGNLSVPGAPSRPAPTFVLNTGDNIYNVGSEDNYRDFFFPVLNNDTDSNETGAPILRSMPYFVVDGNHDLGSTGVSANLLADNTPLPFNGSLSGGDALGFFNDLYYPLNGPTGVDIQNAFNGDTATPNGFLFSYQGNNYTSPAAIEAFRASTTVDTGKGATRQIDHQSNYSFDYGNAHFIYLDANPHLFNDILPGGSASTTPPPPPFTAYPSILRNWVINDLDSSKQTWKVAVFHQPAFSSGDATVLNNQMRAVAKILEDHGVNVVFNGHEHNYQRSLPIRATPRTAGTPSTAAGTPAVYVDPMFDGQTSKVPDGVIYIVEGAGGNRDFDGDFLPPRGSGTGVDQDDSASGPATSDPSITQGSADWLDTNLTNLEMITNFPNAGAGQKITSKFKSKVFSFGHVVVNRNNLTLYQISEPLTGHSSATTSMPAPYGTDYMGVALTDPIPDTLLDATTGTLVSAPASGTSALLDSWTITKPNISEDVRITLSVSGSARVNQQLVYTVSVKNNSAYSLNGAQVRLTLPRGLTYSGGVNDNVTLNGSELVYTIGRLAKGASAQFTLPVQLASHIARGSWLIAQASLYSATALPVTGYPVLSVCDGF